MRCCSVIIMYKLQPTFNLLWFFLIFYLPPFPRVVGKSPSVPLTSGWTVSPKYTGKAKEATPTQNPVIDLPAKIILIFDASAIIRNAKKTNKQKYFINFVDKTV